MSSTPRNTRERQHDISTRLALGNITNVTDEVSRQRKGEAETAIEQQGKKAAFTDPTWLTLAPAGFDQNAGPNDENAPNILANGNVETDAHDIRGSTENPADRAAKRKERNAARQRAYRARKKAAVPQIVPASSPAGAGFGTGLLENDESANPTEWPPRNDNYVPRARGPRTVPFGPLPTQSDDDDDDCVILEGYPDKSAAVAKEEGGPSRADAENELQIVAEKGEIACRDFPHPRHLCAALPFSTSSHASHCSMCYCYVCDCRAPCPSWLLHCDATDKDSKWKELRQSKIKSRPNPKPSLPQHFNRSVTTAPSSLLNRSVTTAPSSQNATGFIGGFLAPSPMPSTIRSYGSEGAQVAPPPIYASSNGNQLQPSCFPSYGLVQPARPRASQPAHVSLGGHVSAETSESYPPQFPVGAPMRSQGHHNQYRPSSYPQLAPNTVGLPLSRYSSLNPLAQGTQRPQVPSPGIMSNLAHQLALRRTRDVLLAQAAQKNRGLLQQLSQIGASSGQNSSNHAPGGTVLSSGSVQIQQPLPQLQPGTALSSSSAQIEQTLPQLNPGTPLPSASSHIQQLYLRQSNSQSSVTPRQTAPNTLYLPRK